MLQGNKLSRAAGSAIVAAICLWPTACTSGRPAAETNVIARATAAYVPPWIPAEKQLAGVTVVIDPAGGGRCDPAPQREDDLALWTAGHLYHLVRLAGGTPVLTRPDDRPAQPQAVEAIMARRMAVGTGTFVVTIQGDQATLTCNPLGNTVRAGPSSMKIELARAADPPAADRLPLHRRRAEQLYHAIEAAARNTAPATTTGESTEAVASSVEPPPVPFYPRTTRQTPFQKAAVAIWPEGKLPITKAAWYAEMYTRWAFSDRTHLYFEPLVRVEGDEVIITGATSEAILLDTIKQALTAVGIERVRSEMRLLPEQGNLGEQWFGTCVATMALTFTKPSEGAPPQTQLLYGEPVYLLDRADGFYLLLSGDGYWGWVREGCVRPMSRAEFSAYTALPPAVVLMPIEGPGLRITPGCRLPVIRSSTGRATLKLPAGEELTVNANRVQGIEDAAQLAARAPAALALLDVPYVFAGRSSLGLDCSGLVGGVCERQGLILARDAAQQFVAGRLVATRWYRDNLRAGDRICFLNEGGKIFHTGLAMDGTHFVHCSPPCVQISSLRKGDRLYNPQWDAAFVAAKRP